MKDHSFSSFVEQLRLKERLDSNRKTLIKEQKSVVMSIPSKDEKIKELEKIVQDLAYKVKRLQERLDKIIYKDEE